MSVSPDPVEASVPLDPSAYRARPLMGPVFWAMVGAVLALIFAGALAWAAYNFAPGLKRAIQAPILPPVRIAAYEPPPVVRSAAAQPPAPEVEAADVSGLSQRLAALEAAQARTAAAAAAALASAALVEASQGSQPFADELASLEAVAPDNAELPALRRLARTGAASRTALIASYPDYAARAAVAGNAPGQGAGLGARIVYALSRVVTLRRVGDVEGGSVDAVLARAEVAANDGDLDQAMRLLDTLPPGAREAFAPWRARAERRAEIDRRVSAVRNQALADLVRVAGPAS